MLAEANSVITGVTTALAEFSPANLSTVLVAGLGVAVPLVIGWFAYRFIYNKAKGALKSGK